MAARKVIYTAAHGGFAGLGVPLGGGAAISEWLHDEWRGRSGFDLELVTPAILGPAAPSGRDITRFGERAYARFCLDFGQAATRRILDRDPSSCAVLVNDIAEAPDFARLAAAGFRIVTIYHVDVVDYIASIYLRRMFSAAALAGAWQRLRRFAAPVAPAILTLIFERQRDSLIHSHRVVVPSARMKSILLGAYPATPPGRIDVVPWGVRPEPAPECEIAAELASIRARFGLDPGSPAMLCLSRISPEKGQDLLLEGLIELERRGGFAERPPAVLVCGEPAFMRGQAHMDRLRRLAPRLKRARVHFPATSPAPVNRPCSGRRSFTPSRRDTRATGSHWPKLCRTGFRRSPWTRPDRLRSLAMGKASSSGPGPARRCGWRRSAPLCWPIPHAAPRCQPRAASGPRPTPSDGPQTISSICSAWSDPGGPKSSRKAGIQSMNPRQVLPLASLRMIP